MSAIYEFQRRRRLRQQFDRDQRRRLGVQQAGPVVLPTFSQIVSVDHLLATAKHLKAIGNDKAPGPDGLRFRDLSVQDLGDICRDLHRQLVARIWMPSTASIVPIPKVGGFRELWIRSIETRIVSAAVHRGLSPHWETVYLDCSYGFRAGRGVVDMLLALELLITRYNRWIIVQDESAGVHTSTSAT
jgi:hypothetical protein